MRNERCILFLDQVSPATKALRKKGWEEDQQRMTPCLDLIEGSGSFGSRPRPGTLISICPASSASSFLWM